MSRVQQRRDTVASPSLVYALLFLDPRRWAGALIAVFGVLASIVVSLFPKALLERTPSEPAAAQTHTRVLIRRRPFSTPGQSIIAASSPARSQTAGDAPLLPHVTFSSDRHPRFSAPSSLSTTLAIESNPSNLSSIPSSPSSLTASMPPASPMPYIHPLALPSLDSLDLAADADTLTDKPLASPNAKRHFRVPLPKLGFGRRQSATDLHSLKSAETSNITVLSTSSDNTTVPQNNHPCFLEWQGTRSFAVRRTNSIASAPSSDKTQASSSSRRKFSLFSREPSSPSLYKNKDDALPVIPASQSPPFTAIPLIAEPPSPTVLRSIGRSLPSNVVDTPPRSRSVSSPVSHANLEDMIPLEQTTTPPARPARTDPYKMYGVPVPGSDRARAFLKAEKERIRAERERRERQKAVSEHGIQREAHAGSVGSGRRNSEQQVGSEKTKRRERKCSSGFSKKGKEQGTSGHRSGAGDEADTEDEKHGMEEFGVLPLVGGATSASPQAQARVRRTSSQVKHSWVFSRHSSEATGEKGGKRREKKEKEKVREKLVKERSSKLKTKDPDSATSKGRPKSRDSAAAAAAGSKKTSFGFRSKDTQRNKDRGYSSDTNVPSLTYKLMT